MSTEHTWRKPKPALSQFSPHVETHLGTFANWQKLDHTVSWSEHHISSQNSEEWNLHWSTRLLCWKTDLSFNVFFFLFPFFLFAKGPCKSCPLYLRPGVHRLTAGWEESMMGKTWWALTLVGEREREREGGRERERERGRKGAKRVRVCEGGRRSCLHWMKERDTETAGGKILKYSQQRKRNKERRIWRHKTTVTVIKIRLPISKHF